MTDKNVIFDPTFGELKWDERFEWWTGYADFAEGYRVEIAISPDEEQIKPVLEIVRDLYLRIKNDEEYIRDEIAEFLLEEHNENWNDGKKTGKKEFMERVKLSSLVLFSDGEAEAYYEDGGLFGGNDVLVNIDDEGTVTDVMIAG